jgi:hypothetical protein
MTTATMPRVISRPRWITAVSWILSALPVLILLSSAWVRATQRTNAINEIVASYGYPESAIPRIVIAECVLVLLYLIPQTAVLGAIILTGYLGGAVATHVRIGDPARAMIPLIAGILAWAGLYLRDERIRQLLPLRRRA